MSSVSVTVMMVMRLSLMCAVYMLTQLSTRGSQVWDMIHLSIIERLVHLALST